MFIKQIVGVGVSRALGTGIIADLVGDAAQGVIQTLNDHLTLDGHDLATAFQDSLGRGAAAIALGLSPVGAGALAANLAKEYAAGVERDYLLPYAESRGLAQAAVVALRRKTLDQCRVLTDQRVAILPAAELDQTTLAGLAQGVYREDLSALLLERCTEALPDLDPEVRGLLAHQGLLGDALLWFLRETLRADPRVRAMLDALQREGLWADLRDIKAAQVDLTRVLTDSQVQCRVEATEALQTGDFARAGQLSTQLQALAERQARLPDLLQQAQAQWLSADGRLLRLAEASGALAALVETGLGDLAGALTEVGVKLDQTLAAAEGARDAARAAGVKVDVWGGRLRDDLAGLGDGIGAQLDAMPHIFLDLLQRVLRPGGLGIRVSPDDEFTHHDSAARGLILQAQAELARLPQGPGYSVAALAVGSALSSTGAAAEAEALFLRAREAAQGDPERALAGYNLFQARLRQGPGRYPEALTALRQAVALDPSYATHEEWKYPTQSILGAGGMGCAFLCRQPVKGNRRVVVKTFWRAASGAVQDIFAEATTMDRVGRAHVPGLLDYGFARGTERPYIVMEYLDGYQDGEAWLREHGPLPLARGLDLSRRVLQALVVAHAAGVVHLDLKPANLLLKPEGDGIAVKIIDFGLARVAERVDGVRAPGATPSGLSVLGTAIAGTWDYAPPEQMGKIEYGEPGPGSDLYAFGATWYRLLTGRHPNNRRTKYLPLGCPRALYELIQDLLEHDPRDRPEGAEVVLAQLQELNIPLPPVEDIHGWPAAKVQALQQVTALALGRPIVFRDRLKSGGEGPEMVVIPAGRFLMGLPPLELEVEGEFDADSRHQVTISRPFALGRHALTVGEYRAFVAATKYQTYGELHGGIYCGWWDYKGDPRDISPVRSWRNPGFGQNDSHPVVGVSWNDAVAYCQWLSEQTGQPYRLPTEAEWEYACRAGTTTAFHFGETISTEQANFNGKFPHVADSKKRKRAGTVKVQAFPANPWGLHQMHGNVTEWCQDNWGEYPTEASVDPQGPVANGISDFRVLRGGSYGSPPWALRSASRSHSEPLVGEWDAGFRVALALEPGQAWSAAVDFLAQPGLAPVGAASHNQSSVHEAEDIHGWPAAKVQALQQVTALALGRPIVFRDRLKSGGEGPEMVVIPAGSFLMGAPEEEAPEEEWEAWADMGWNPPVDSQHQVTISRPIALGRYALTFDEYDAFCAASGRNRPDDAGWGRGRRPVIHVSWNDAVAYCQWLSEQTGQLYRLPTEAEWEYACRAGTTTAFHFGETISTEQANFNGHYSYCYLRTPEGLNRASTVEVQAFPANPWGLHQMHGNATEWCQDNRDQNGMHGNVAWWTEASVYLDHLVGRNGRVCRGGGWDDMGSNLRSSIYDTLDPDACYWSGGVRLALGDELGEAGAAGDGSDQTRPE